MNNRIARVTVMFEFELDPEYLGKDLNPEQMLEKSCKNFLESIEDPTDTNVKVSIVRKEIL